MRILTFLLVIFSSLQSAIAQQSLQLTKVMELQMEGEGGSNGASVAWHSVGKKYYAAMAGNASYPLCVFNQSGSLISNPKNESMVDVRGLWFNAKKAKIQGNAFGEAGWFEYILNVDGMPTDFKKMVEGASQPDDQCVGTFSSKTNEVIFFDGMDIYFYDAITGEVKESISFEQVLTNSGIALSEKENYNTRSILYTGKPGQELGLLNVEKKQLELFSLEGKRSLILKVPSNQTVYASFNMAFANGMYWFFNKDNRKWIGYKEGGAATSTSTLTPAPTSGSKGAYGKTSKILKVGDLYSTFNIAGDYPAKVNEWKKEFGEAATQEILKRSEESGWPSAINSLTGRDDYRDRFVDFNCYHFADLGNDYVLLWIPISENKHMPSALISTYDYYMVYNRSAVQLGDKVKPKFAATGATLTGAGSKPATNNQARATKITDPGQLYSTYNLEADESGVVALLKREYGEAGAAEIFKRAKESGWPYGINDFTRRSEYRDRFTEYTAYYIAEVGPEKALLWVPMNKNTGVPSAMQGENDIFFVYGKKGLSLGDKVKATVVVSQEKQDNRAKPVTGTLGGGKTATPNTNTNTKTTAAATGNFVQQMETLIKSYVGNFSSIQGKKIEKDAYDIFEKWETTVKLAGSIKCYLTEGILNEHMEFVAEFGANYSKQAATSKMNALIAEVVKAKPTGISIVKDEMANKETSVIQYLVSVSSAPKEYEYFLIELGIYRVSNNSDNWSVELRIYSEEEE